MGMIIFDQWEATVDKSGNIAFPFDSLLVWLQNQICMFSFLVNYTYYPYNPSIIYNILHLL